MKILMMTNTYHPIVGGLERSVEILTKELRDHGHQVLIVAPEFEGAPENEEGVVRLPAIQNFNGTDFSVELPLPSNASDIIDEFNPDIVHTHHPFLIGDTALRIAAKFSTPLVFTYHTLYERYTHYVPGDSEAMKKFVVELTKGYANLCDHVIVPSQSIEHLLQKRGIETALSVVPTGIYTEKFNSGNRDEFRKAFGIAEDSFLFGTIGRVAKEKNIDFLTDVAGTFLQKNDRCKFLCVGNGPEFSRIKEKFDRMEMGGRLILPGVIKGGGLADAYKAMDIFVFASHTETQGLVLAEAMAAGVPVVAVDAPGVREILTDGKNGRMILEDDKERFIEALCWFKELGDDKRRQMTACAIKTSEEFSVKKMVEKTLGIYTGLVEGEARQQPSEGSLWHKTRRLIEAEAQLISNMAASAGTALLQVPRQTTGKMNASVKQKMSKDRSRESVDGSYE